MAWREKVAWLSIGVILIVYGAYFSVIAGTRHTAFDTILLFGVAAAVHAVAMILGTAVLAVRARDEARAKPDERDRAINRRGVQIAYFVLMFWMIMVGVVMPFNNQGLQITNAALFALVLAELSRYLVVVISYRRGWHG